MIVIQKVRIQFTTNKHNIMSGLYTQILPKVTLIIRNRGGTDKFLFQKFRIFYINKNNKEHVVF